MTHKKLLPLSFILAVLLALFTISVKHVDSLEPSLDKGKPGTYVLVRRSAQFFEQPPPPTETSNRPKWTRREFDLKSAFVAHLLEVGPHWV